MNIKLIPCKCGEPVNDELTLCPQCIDEVNRRAKSTLEIVIEALGRGKLKEEN